MGLPPPTTKALTPEHVNSRDETYDSEDSDYDYYFHTYAPLSCFPTPPLSSHTSSPPSPFPNTPSDSSLDTSLRGPASYLSNLIPCAASLLSPSPSLTHTLLTHANLPLETLALSACILDSLTPRFATLWRRSLPLSSLPTESQHIDTVRPEVIILSALMIAHKFLDDTGARARTYSDVVGEGMWGVEMLNVTERCVLENLGWRVARLWRGELIEGAEEDMRRAGVAWETAGKRVSGGARMKEGLLTPVEGVVGEDIR
ncbi:hypothetical protein V496_00355 [Pseudogymnoascus sp. VKM F-4515 (FW-2607)]|nr:hypothetical protein V496_00355 [Pseudogymnoascus sp. VKM F-4515 (FW-2607)]